MREFTHRLKGMLHAHPRAVGAALILLALLLPWLLPSSYLRGIAVRIVLYMLFATGLNVTNGYGGQFNIGFAGFMCVGAYTAGILATSGQIPFIPALIAAGLVAAFFGFLISLPTSRLSGMYLSIVTMGFSEIIRIIVLNWSGLTGGPLGIKNIPRPSFFGLEIKTPVGFYYLALALLLIALFCVYRLIHSRVGRAWISIRENPDAASSLGVNIRLYKAINFMVSAFIAGMGGTFMAFYYRYLATDMFMIDNGHEVLAMVVLGGMGTMTGPMLGSLVINLVTEAFRFASDFRLVAYAVLIIVMMWVRPQGLAGASNSILASQRADKKKQPEKREKT
ncbi:MAG: branched-chain amino acid ABC transporter permease [Eubacteriales bacterium]|nr:branched-chain amino acid ABC transporter permease [Eubacteriales bacterium]